MKVILKEDVKNLGTMGQIVDVSDRICKKFSYSEGACRRGERKEHKIA